MLSIDRRACRNYRGRVTMTWSRGDGDTLTVASSVDASSGCLASDCNALRAVFGIPDNYNNITTI